jgi:hypothetical protein
MNPIAARAEYRSLVEHWSDHMRYVGMAGNVALVLVAGATAAVQKGGGSLHATLTGKVEVPKGDPNGTGTAEVKITGTTVCWEIKTAKVGKIVAAHIHKGGAGVAGPVVVPFGKVYKSKGCFNSTASIVAGIKKNPGAYYVNVHNATYPGGALRGQLHADG